MASVPGCEKPRRSIATLYAAEIERLRIDLNLIAGRLTEDACLAAKTMARIAEDSLAKQVQLPLTAYQEPSSEALRRAAIKLLAISGPGQEEREIASWLNCQADAKDALIPSDFQEASNATPDPGQPAGDTAAKTGTNDARDAARWRAVMASARIRVLGSAGFGHGGQPADPDGYRHFGAEFWTHHTASEGWDGKNVLTEYADAIIARQETSSGAG